jgi:import inner membrane translocase subunit TIM22
MITTIECSLETLRGKKDIKNAIVAGFTSGAVIAARSGPTAALLSGGMFAGFSVAMEIAAPYLFGH